jgi:hypothetical protein
MLPPLTKGVSLTSLKAKQKKRKNPQQYATAPESSFAEITRLIALNDEQKAKIDLLVSETKTLRIVYLL